MHWVFSVCGGTSTGPNCTVKDWPPGPASFVVTSPSTGPASALGPPLLLALPELLPEELPPPELPPLLPLLLPPLLLPPLPPFPDEPDELHAAMTQAHVSAKREDRMGDNLRDCELTWPPLPRTSQRPLDWRASGDLPRPTCSSEGDAAAAPG